MSKEPYLFAIFHKQLFTNFLFSPTRIHHCPHAPHAGPILACSIPQSLCAVLKFEMKKIAYGISTLLEEKTDKKYNYDHNIAQWLYANMINLEGVFGGVKTQVI